MRHNCNDFTLPSLASGHSIMSQQPQHSRLGQILINKGLITSKQLDEAIKLQLTSKKRLGEILVEQGLVTEKQIHKALRKQTNLRLTATLVAALMMPFQPLLASQRGDLSADIVASQNIDALGMQPLSELEMSDVHAQGLEQTLQQVFTSAQNGDGVDTLQQLAKLVMPVLDSLQAEQSMKDVVYDTANMTSTFNADGSINVRLPSSIGEMRFDNIRVAGAPTSQSMGSLVLSDIDLSSASLTIKVRP